MNQLFSLEQGLKVADPGFIPVTTLANISVSFFVACYIQVCWLKSLVEMKSQSLKVLYSSKESWLFSVQAVSQLFSVKCL